MDTSTRLNLPFLMPNQAQKHVTMNESLLRLDTVVHLTVHSRNVNEAPSDALEGDAYLLPGETTGSNWQQGSAGEIAVKQGGAWVFYVPQDGWRAYDLDTGSLIVFQNDVWRKISNEDSTAFGVNTSADETNRLAVKSDAELLTYDDVTPGTGDARKVINKSTSGHTSSVRFQDNFQGRAEIGLLGDNDFHLRLSQDGALFQDAAVFDHNSGQVRFSGGVAHSVTGASMNSFIFTPGGDGEVSIYRVNAAHAQNPRQFTLANISGDRLQVSGLSTEALFLNAFMEGVSLVRIWNLSRIPFAPAWIRRADGADALNVSDAAHIAGWLSGDLLQLGDPEEITPNRCIAVDISPLLKNILGTSFPQAGVMLKLAVGGKNGTAASLDVSSNGLSGSFSGVRSTDGGGATGAQVTIASTEPSQISPSNLVFIREHSLGALNGLSIVSLVGVFAR